MNETNEIKTDDWYFFADRDLSAAGELLGSVHLTNVVAFHCQQAVEKYIKAFLVANQIPTPKIHDLSKLYNSMKCVIDFCFDESILELLTQLYNDDRYPGGGIGLLPHGEPSQEEAETFYRFAQEVEKKIKDYITQIS